MTEPIHAPDHVNLYIVTPEDVVYEGQVRWAQVPLEDGWIGIWPGHAPLIAAVSEGNVRFDTGKGIESIPVAKGILRIAQGRCAVLVGSLISQSDASNGGPETLAGDLEAALLESLPEDQIQELQKE